MNHVAIVLKQMRDKAERQRAELAQTEAAIAALGGASAAGKPVQRRRGPNKAKGATTAAAPRKSPPNAEVLSPALAAELVAIKANTALSPIQKAQASRKARAKYRAIAAPAQPQGAVLSEA